MGLKRTPLKKSYKPIKKVSDKQKIKNQEKKELSIKQREFFLSLWDEREIFDGNSFFCRCGECNKKLSRQFYRGNSCCYSHLLPKSKYPEYRFLPENILIVCPGCHSQFETFSEKAPNQYDLQKKLLKKLESRDLV